MNAMAQHWLHSTAICTGYKYYAEGYYSARAQLHQPARDLKKRFRSTETSSRFLDNILLGVPHPIEQIWFPRGNHSYEFASQAEPNQRLSATGPGFPMACHALYVPSQHLPHRSEVLSPAFFHCNPELFNGEETPPPLYTRGYVRPCTHDPARISALSRGAQSSMRELSCAIIRYTSGSLAWRLIPPNPAHSPSPSALPPPLPFALPTDAIEVLLWIVYPMMDPLPRISSSKSNIEATDPQALGAGRDVSDHDLRIAGEPIFEARADRRRDHRLCEGSQALKRRCRASSALLRTAGGANGVGTTRRCAGLLPYGENVFLCLSSTAPGTRPSSSETLIGRDDVISISVTASHSDSYDDGSAAATDAFS